MFMVIFIIDYLIENPDYISLSLYIYVCVCVCVSVWFVSEKSIDNFIFK